MLVVNKVHSRMSQKIYELSCERDNSGDLDLCQALVLFCMPDNLFSRGFTWLSLGFLSWWPLITSNSCLHLII